MDSLSSRFQNLSPLKQALLAIEELQQKVAESETRRTEPIAIVGMACRFPHAPNTESFWRLLENGEDAITEVPPSRWKLEDYYDPDPEAPGKMSTRWGGFLEDIDLFDAEFFGISPREATNMDPQQRLLLEVTWEALEHAGQGPRDLVKCRTGVFVGVSSDEFSQLFYRSGDLSTFNAYFASGVARSVAGGRISYALGIEGPNLSIDTACSSSLVAIHTACLYLRSGECRMAIAGGANTILSPEIGITFTKSRMMAADGRSKTFDASADGFVRSEGCGIVVLKRLSDAYADGDRILALVRGSAINQDGRSSGLTAPNRAAQEAVIRQALASGAISREEIDYIEAHGTGTALGDPIEARALASVLGPGRTQEHPLVVGSVKTNIGHLESAAGIAGLIKTVLALQHERIPPHLNFKQMNPLIDWNGMPVEIPVKGRQWPRGSRRRLAGISSFGFSGTNAHAILEESPVRESVPRAYDRPLHILAVSARSASALAVLTGRYADLLSKGESSIGDIAFTANAGRAHFAHRIAAVGSSFDELRTSLFSALPGEHIRDREGIHPVFLFPDAGALRAGIGKELYDTHPTFRSTLDECARLLDPFGQPLHEILWGAHTHLLSDPAYKAPALLALEYALAQLWRDWGIEPATVAGIGVGEFAAACVAGVWSLEDGLKLVTARACMEESKFELALRAVRLQEPRIKLLSAVTGSETTLDQMRSPQHFQQAGPPQGFSILIHSLQARGMRVFLESGPSASPLLEESRNSKELLYAASLRAERGEWTQMLDSLARLYVQGADVDWGKFDAPYGRRRVDLPTYPFERQRYWPENPACYPKPPQRQIADAHPLLGPRVDIAREAGTCIWEKRINIKTLPYLADHGAFGTLIFPLTGYLEMMRAALTGSGSRAALEELIVYEPLTLTQDDDKTLQVSLHGDLVEIYSRQKGQWRRHAAARRATEAMSPTDWKPFSKRAERMGKPSDDDFLYRIAFERGMHFGPAFRTVQKIRVGSKECLANISRLEAHTADEGYEIHPALLDGCLQILATALPESGLYLPFRMERFDVFRPAGKELSSHAVLRDSKSGDSLLFDFQIFDEAGPIACVTGLEMRRANSDTSVKAAKRPVSFFELHWEECERTGNPIEATGNWLIVAGENESGNVLAERLSALGAQTTLVRDISRIRATAAGKQWRGVVYLSAADVAVGAAMNLLSPADVQQQVCGAAIDLAQVLAKQAGKPPRLWLITRGAQMVTPQQSSVTVAQSTLWGMTQAIADEYPEWHPVLIDVDPDRQVDTLELLGEILSDEVEEQLAFRNGKRFVARFRPRRVDESLEDPLRLAISSRGVLDNLRVERAERRSVPPGSVEIEVDAAALNFRDVLNVLGMYPGEEGPLGSECAGRILSLGAGVEGWQLGDDVVAGLVGGHDGFVIADSRLVARRPRNLTASQAATIITAFLTARYTLEQLAQIRSSDSVLIHAATGGVGLAAIQIAQRAGAEIFATAGSDRKRDFLRSLGVPHVMNSRTLNFAGEILKQTGGRGVNIVLNSLTGDFIPASFSVLAPEGRFLEIGKRDIWNSDRVAELGRNIAYHIVDLGQVGRQQPEVLGALLRDTVAAIERGELQPLPAHVFPFHDAVSAYRLMAQAQHIGKVVLRQNAAEARICGNATYLVTGAFGGIGLRVVEWLIEKGARNLALIGRRDPSPDARVLLRHAELRGVCVRTFAADVACEDEMQHAFGEMRRSMPPLRGILHAAGSLDDGIIAKQNWLKFEKPLEPKVRGSWILHRLTEPLPIDFFVMFSSSAAVLGAPGLSNYAAANAFEDALAHERRRMGLPAISINWGTWAEGMALIDGMEERRQAAGITAMKPEEALGALERILLDRPVQVGAGLMDWKRFINRDRTRPVPKRFRTLLEPERSETPEEPSGLARQLSGHPAAVRLRILQEHIEQLAARILGFPPNRHIDSLQPLNELGLDSLMAVDFRNALASTVKQNLPATLLFSHPSVQDLTSYLAEILFPASPVAETERISNSSRILEQIEDLSDEEVERQYAQKVRAF
jgi:acyl transferase domain-containing protein/short-subunit dehydrogenase